MMKKTEKMPRTYLGLLLAAALLAGCGSGEKKDEQTPAGERSGSTAEVKKRDARDISRPPFTPAQKRLAGYAKRRELQQNSLLKNVAFRSIGPSVMSGRVVDLDVNPDNPTEFYVAYASGGLWKTSDDGISFTPLFDDQAVMTIGDIAVDWKNGETIWVGTGENNSSRSSYSGTGIYKSTDGGASWQHLGLAETHHIGRIVLHPDDPNTVWVAAMGHLYSFNPERGVYKTTDGGQTWEKTLYIDEGTGAIDLIIDNSNPEVLYAAMWYRMRYAWNFVESGETSGIYKSEDGGESWKLLTTQASGFPVGKGVGRIGLALYEGQPQKLFALLDNQFRRPEKDDSEQAAEALTREQLQTMSKEAFLSLDEKTLNRFLDDNNFPMKYTARQIMEKVRNDELTPRALVDFLEDANRELFDTPVIGAEVYVSEDGGTSWRKTHEDYLDGLYYSYGYYFGEIRVAAHDADKLYILGVPLLMSADGGKSWASIGKANVHGDHHALWVNPTRPGHLINGNDGGVNITYDDGEHWFKANSPAVGQFYAIAVDMAQPYNVYGGLQDNGVWVGPSSNRENPRWHASGRYPFKMILGGDGMQVEVDTRDNATVYTGFQFGFYSRVNRNTGKRQSIKPQHELGERPLRFNWQSPIKLSPHNQDILYFGTNKLYRSMDQGRNWQAISEDLTNGGIQGDVPYGTLTTIDESPLQFGLLYVGSDDGLIHLSRDGGFRWQRISDELPQNLWVSRVEASHHEQGTVYITLNGYRFDDFSAYLYRSRDYGETWQRLGENLPDEPLNVVVEDPENAELLYVGSDHSVYISLDGGETFQGVSPDLPAAPVHDLVVHPRDRDLVVGTHGRSIYIANVEHIQQLRPEVLQKTVHLFSPAPVTYDTNFGRKFSPWSTAREPETEIAFYVREAGKTTIRIKLDDGRILQELQDDSERGLNYLSYDLSVQKERKGLYQNALRSRGILDDAEELRPADNGKLYLRPGTYTIEIVHGTETATGTLQVKEGRKKRKRG